MALPELFSSMHCDHIPEKLRAPGYGRGQDGMTLVELLVVVAIIGVLAGMLLPTLGKATSRARGMQCLSNTHQLTLGWLMYADDHNGKLCPNGIGSKQGWVEGNFNFGNAGSDSTNLVYLTDPQYAKLSPYVGSSAVYRCPSDRSFVTSASTRIPRVRSLAMNQAVGYNATGETLPASAGWRVYRKMEDIRAPSPAGLWILIEQHPDSIDDGRFGVDCNDRDNYAQWIDFPANYHDRACSLSFADGHSEIHTWVDTATLQPNKYCGCLSHYAAEGYFTHSPNSQDIAWLQARTSAK